MLKQKGFTLVELLVVVVIIGILAAIALPNFIGAQQKAKTAAVKANMRTCQIAAESYATDSGGVYSVACAGATTAADYLPGGSNSIIGGTAGPDLINPISNAGAAITAAPGGVVATLRATPPVARPAAGDTFYSQLAVAAAGDSYMVCGSDAKGILVGGGGPGTTLVLSNQ